MSRALDALRKLLAHQLAPSDYQPRRTYRLDVTGRAIIDGLRALEAPLVDAPSDRYKVIVEYMPDLSSRTASGMHVYFTSTDKRCAADAARFVAGRHAAGVIVRTNHIRVCKPTVGPIDADGSVNYNSGPALFEWKCDWGVKLADAVKRHEEKYL